MPRIESNLKRSQFRLRDLLLVSALISILLAMYRMSPATGSYTTIVITMILGGFVLHTGKVYRLAGVGERRNVLWLLAAVHIAFGASCSPEFVRSSDWRVWGLPPRAPYWMAHGAVWVYPMILYPLWASLGPGSLWPRLASTLFLCLAYVSAVVARGRIRISNPPSLASSFVSLMVLVMACFSLISLCFWCIQQFGKSRAPRRPDKQRLKFRLRHVWAAITAGSCLLALYRLNFPEGMRIEAANSRWREITSMVQKLGVRVLMLLPSVFFPWAVLAIRGKAKFSIFAAAVVSCSLAYDWALITLIGNLRSYSGQEVLWIQLGGCGVGTVSAIILRSCGYRIGCDEFPDSALLDDCRKTV